MNILNVNSSLSYIKAIVPNNIQIISSNNQKVILQKATYSQASSSSSPETVKVQYDRKLVASIFRNSDP